MTDPQQELTKDEQGRQAEATAVAERAAEEPRRKTEDTATAEAEAMVQSLAGARPEPAEQAQIQPKAPAEAEFLGGLLADAARALTGPGRTHLRQVAVVVLLVANLLVMAFFAGKLAGGGSEDRTSEPRRQEHAATGPKLQDARGGDFEAAIRAGREKRHADAIRLLERHVKTVALPPEELLLVYQQLALQCRLAGRMEESVRYGAFAQSLSHKAWRAEDLLESAGAARSDGRLVDARRILARFLLMEASLPANARARVPKAMLQLAETWQEDAMRQEGRKQ